MNSKNQVQICGTLTVWCLFRVHENGLKRRLLNAGPPILAGIYWCYKKKPHQFKAQKMHFCRKYFLFWLDTYIMIIVIKSIFVNLSLCCLSCLHKVKNVFRVYFDFLNSEFAKVAVLVDIRILFNPHTMLKFSVP